MRQTTELITQSVKPKTRSADIAASRFSVRSVDSGKRLFWWGTGWEESQERAARQLRCDDEVLEIVPGESHLFVQTRKSGFRGVGSNRFKQLTASDIELLSSLTILPISEKIDIASIFSGPDHVFAISRSGEMWAWGNNLKEQLGLGETPPVVSSPARVKSLSPRRADISGVDESLLDTGEFVYMVACGPFHTVTLTNKKRIFVCGWGEHYALGLGTSKNLSSFTEMTFFLESEQKVEMIRCGSTHSGALVAGQVYVWGSLQRDKMFLFQKPNKLVINSLIHDFVMGDYLTVILTTKGEILTLGENTDFQLGYLGGATSTPQKVPLSSKIESVRCGLNHVIAIAQNSIFGWGSNRHGQLFPQLAEVCFDCPEEIEWMIKGQVVKVVCGPLSTFALSNQELQAAKSSFSFPETEQIIKNMMQEMEEARAVYESLENENTELIAEIQKVYSTLGSLKEPNAEDPMQKFKNELKKNRTLRPCFEIDFSLIKLLDKISENDLWVISRGNYREVEVSVKVLKKNAASEANVTQFLTECVTLESLRHPNIVLFLGACTKDPNNLAIVQEYFSKGTLSSYLRDPANNITLQDRIEKALDIAKGMHYLHSFTPPVLHRDLNSDHVLLDEFFQAKITDFGWTRILSNEMTGLIGTHQYMAPEVIAKKRYTEKADIYSFGILFWEIMTSEVPYAGMSTPQIIFQVTSNNYRPEIPSNVPKRIAVLMQKCWETEHLMRPNFKDVIAEIKIIKRLLLGKSTN